jgi:chromosomal replication initiation ATPase DnaA
MIAQHMIEDQAMRSPRQRNADGVGSILADAARLSREPTALLIGTSRKRSLVYVRFAIIWVARLTTVKSTTQIGVVLGGRRHTTILAALRKAEALRGTDGYFRAFTNKLLHKTLQRMCS